MTEDTLAGLLAPTVAGLGYELLGVERQRSGGSTLVRLYIDSERGIGVDDCEKVSRQVGDVLEVEQAVRGDYTLEVSSPGLDRPLFNLGQYRKHVGAEVKLRLRMLFDGRRNVSGELVEVTDGAVTIEAGGERFEVPFNIIERGRLVPRW